MATTKKIHLFTLISFILANLFAYLLFHIPTLVLEETYEWLEYTRAFITKFIEFVLPTVSATVLFIDCYELGTKQTLIKALTLSLPRILYLLPYYYVYYIVLAFDSIEAVFRSLLVTLFGTALFFGVSLLLLHVMRVFSRMPFVKELKKSLPVNLQERTPKDVKRKLVEDADKKLAENIGCGNVFDFSCPENLGIFASVFFVFGIELIREIIESIIFVIECEGILFADEIIYMTGCYLFLLVELILAHTLSVLIKNHAKKQTTKNISEE